MAELTGLTWTTTGIGDVAKRLHLIVANVPPESAKSLYKLGQIIMTDSKDNYVPVDDGPLRSSGQVHEPVVEPGLISVTLSYGGAASAYALAVHEHLSSHSPRSWKAAEAAGRNVRFSPAGHGPKYLERPVMAHAHELPTMLGGTLMNVAHEAAST